MDALASSPSRKAWWFRDNSGSIGRKQPNASLVTTNWVSVGIRDKAAWCVTDLQQRASHPWAHRRDGRMGPPRRSSRPAPCSRPRTPARRPRECYLQTRSGPINISRFRKSVEDAIAPIEVDGPATCGIRWRVTLTDAAACRDVKVGGGGRCCGV